MESSKTFWTIILLLVNIVATLYLVFRMSDYLLELAIMIGLILIALIAVGGLVQKKSWSVNLLSVLYSAILLNLIYLFYEGMMGYLFTAAFVSAVVGFLVAVSIREKRSAKPKIKTYTVGEEKPAKPKTKTYTVGEEKPAKPAAKKTVKKTAKKKKKTAKKKAKKKSTSS